MFHFGVVLLVLFLCVVLVLPMLPFRVLARSHAAIQSRRPAVLAGSRSFASRKRTKKSSIDPFRVLGVSAEDSYVSVKKVFLQVAMKHHPDTSDDSMDDEEHRKIFVGARQAFEMLVAGPEGRAILRSESDKAWEEHDMDEWFRSETGHDMPFMDAATMKEVAEMTDDIGGGLDRDGGMWTLARMVTNSVKQGGDGRDILQLEAGSIRDRQIDGVLRRRRRR